MKYKILVVDDESANTRLLERFLRDDYDVISASSGDEGLDLLAIHDVALIISDQRMPGMTGVEFLTRSAELRPHCVRIILTGYTDAGSLVDALNSGVVYKYVTKPWLNTDLFQTITRGLAHHETIKAQHRLGLENERLRKRVQADEVCVVRLCSEMQYTQDENAPYRAARIRNLSEAIGRDLKMDSFALERLSLAAFLHGIAEIHVPDQLRVKSVDLTDDERSAVQSARQRAYNLLENIPGFEDVADLIKHQFEYFDGSFSPGGLRGEMIPLGSRIIAAAKAYDQMRTETSGFRGLTDSEILDNLSAESGRQLDPAMIDVLRGLKYEHATRIREATVPTALPPAAAFTTVDGSFS